MSSRTGSEPRRRARGQISLEFLEILAFFVFVTTFFSGYFMFQWSEITDSNRNAELAMFANRLAAYIDVASIGGPGFATYFYLPEAFYGHPYTVSINPAEKALEVNCEDRYALSTTITDRILVVRWNPGGTQVLENVDGTVVIR